MYRSLAEAYGWWPDVVNGMSLAQLSMYTSQRAQDAHDATAPRYRGRDIIRCDSLAEAQVEIAKSQAKG